MDPERLLTRMCTRHGLRLEEASRLLPMVERALESPAQIRDRLLRLVEENLARRSPTHDSPSLRETTADLEEEILFSVARILHNWAPSGKILDLSRLLPKLFPGGLDPTTE